MKHFQKHRPTITLIVLYCVVFAASALTLACPKKDAMRKAVDASYRLPVATNKLIDQVRDGRERGILTPEQASNFGGYLNDMAKAEVIYVGMVKALNDAIKTTGKADPAALANLRSFFDAQVIAPFLHVLELAKILSGPSVELILVAISTVRLLMQTIGSGIGSAFVNALAGPGIVLIGNSTLRTT